MPNKKDSRGFKTSPKQAYIGCLLGTAVGDSMGLCYEGLSADRQRRMFPEINRQRFLLGKGMCSDDTEHTCMLAQALLVSGGEAQPFLTSLAWRFRFWLLGLPAGIGLATLRALLKLWVGISPTQSGVFSAGNGPAMRSALLGLFADGDDQKLRILVRASTRLTHTDPKAEYGALAIAVATQMGAYSHPTPQTYSKRIRDLLTEPQATEFLDLVEQTVASVQKGDTTQTFTQQMGWAKGVGGYIYHTVPAVLHTWMRHPKDYQAAIEEIIRCGGDTDTTAAILGAVVGASVGKQGIPIFWLQGLAEWPRSIAWMENVGTKLAQSEIGRPEKAQALAVWAIPFRNLLFMLVVLLHGFRRILPPY